MPQKVKSLASVQDGAADPLLERARLLDTLLVEDCVALLDSVDVAINKKKTPRDELSLDTSRLSLRRRARKRTFLDYSKITCAVNQIRRLPAAEESVHCLMGGDFNGWDLIPAIQTLARKPIDELLITTLSFNESNNLQLCLMLDQSLIRSAAVICSTYFRNADTAIFQRAEFELQRRGQKLIAARNHSKIILARVGSLHYVVESSANLRSCNNLEQFVLTQSRRLYNFHKTWITHVIDNPPV